MLYPKIINLRDFRLIGDRSGEIQLHNFLNAYLYDGKYAKIKVRYDGPGIIVPEEDVWVLIPNGTQAKLESMEFYDLKRQLVKNVHLQNDIIIQFDFR